MLTSFTHSPFVVTLNRDKWGRGPVLDKWVKFTKAASRYSRWAYQQGAPFHQFAALLQSTIWSTFHKAIPDYTLLNEWNWSTVLLMCYPFRTMSHFPGQPTSISSSQQSHWAASATPPMLVVLGWKARWDAIPVRSSGWMGGVFEHGKAWFGAVYLCYFWYHCQEANVQGFCEYHYTPP